jgi:hypothetical protein
LAHAASGYHKVLEENRKLYNQVQDLKGAFVTTFMHGDSNLYRQRFGVFRKREEENAVLFF